MKLIIDDHLGIKHYDLGGGRTLAIISGIITEIYLNDLDDGEVNIFLYRGQFEFYV